jgi:hypothetical protein
LCRMGSAVAGEYEGQREQEKDVEPTREAHVLIIRSDGAGTKASKGLKG